VEKLIPSPSPGSDMRTILLPTAHGRDDRALSIGDCPKVSVPLAQFLWHTLFVALMPLALLAKGMNRTHNGS
jgi:hypothetical protein